MQIKNRTKRKHATLRRERRAAFFSASQTTRGQWDARTIDSPPHPKGRRESRRVLASQARPEVRKFRRGRWVIDLANALRGFARRTDCVLAVRLEFSAVEVYIGGERFNGFTSIEYSTDDGRAVRIARPGDDELGDGR